MDNETIYFYSGKEIQWMINWVFHDYDHQANNGQGFKVSEFMDKRVSEVIVNQLYKDKYQENMEPISALESRRERRRDL